MQTSFVVIPFCYIAYLFKKFKVDLQKISKWYLSFVFLGLLLLFAYYFKFKIELSQKQLPAPYHFYIISIVGIAFCTCTANLILKIKYLNKTFEVIGKHSFVIMAWHVLVFKVIDRIYALCVHETNPNVWGVMPYAYGHLWWVYFILGIAIPLGIGVLYCYLKKKVLRRFVIGECYNNPLVL